ncbi:hypothetical protein ACWEVD_19310 [Nocardia thailandica]
MVHRAAYPNLRVNHLLADALDEGCAGDGLATVAATVSGLADRLQCWLHEWLPGGVLPEARGGAAAARPGAESPGTHR